MGVAFCRADEKSVDSEDITKEPLSLLKDISSSVAPEASTTLPQDNKPDIGSVLPSLPQLPTSDQSPTLPSLSLTSQTQTTQGAPKPTAEEKAVAALNDALEAVLTPAVQQAASDPSPTPSVQKDNDASASATLQSILTPTSQPQQTAEITDSATDPLQQAIALPSQGTKADAAIARATRIQAQEFIRASNKLNLSKPDVDEKLAELLTLYPLATQDKSASQLAAKLIRLVKSQYGDSAFPDTNALVRKEILRIRAEVAETEKNEADTTATETPEKE